MLAFDFEGWDRVAREKGDGAFREILRETFGADFPQDDAMRILKSPRVNDLETYAPRFNTAIRKRLR